MRHLYDILPYVVFAPIPHRNQARQEHTCISLIIFDKLFLDFLKKPLAVVTLSDIVPLKVFGIPHLMIIRLIRFKWSHLSNVSFSSVELLSIGGVGYSILSARSKSKHSRTTMTFSFQSLKLFLFNIEIELTLLDIVKAV